MRVLNIMLGRKLGGIEQAAIDYTAALKRIGHDVTAVIARDAAIKPQLEKLGVSVLEIPFPRLWNPFAAAKLKTALEKCDAVILHGNRAGKMSALVQKINPRPKMIAVAHSRFFDVESWFDAVIALSDAGKNLWSSRTRIPVHILPNMIVGPAVQPRTDFHTPPVIGVMGRFSEEKGIDLFLKALSILKKTNIPFKAVIGGRGELEETLKQQAESLELNDAVTFCGWVSDKKAFFEGIDIFCLPSRSESFSITLVEAMSYGVMCVATDCGGPMQILQPYKTGLICAINPMALAESLVRAVKIPEDSLKMGSAARVFALENYEFSIVAKKLNDILQQVYTRTMADT